MFCWRVAGVDFGWVVWVINTAASYEHSGVEFNSRFAMVSSKLQVGSSLINTWMFRVATCWCCRSPRGFKHVLMIRIDFQILSVGWLHPIPDCPRIHFVPSPADGCSIQSYQVYIVFAWVANFISDVALRYAVVSMSFLMYFRASWTMCRWVHRWRQRFPKGFLLGRPLLAFVLIIVFGIYGIVYLARMQLGSSWDVLEALLLQIVLEGCQWQASSIIEPIDPAKTHLNPFSPNDPTKCR